MKSLLSILLFTLSVTLVAEEKVFIEAVDHKASSLKAVKAAFLERRWKIVAEDENSIQGELNHRRKEALLTIFYKDGSLYYKCECFAIYSGRTKVVKGKLKKDTAKKRKEPTRWIDNLRRSTGLFLARTPLSMQPENIQPVKSIESRLETLEQLLEKGLITEDEYNQKRKALINEL